MPLAHPSAGGFSNATSSRPFHDDSQTPSTPHSQLSLNCSEGSVSSNSSRIDRIESVESVQISPPSDIQHRLQQRHPATTTCKTSQSLYQNEYSHNPTSTKTMTLSGSSMTYVQNSPSPKHPVETIHIPPLKTMKQNNNSNAHQNTKTAFPSASNQSQEAGSPVQITYPSNTSTQKPKKERKRDDQDSQASRDAKVARKNERCADPELRKLKCHQGGTYRFSMSKLHFRHEFKIYI